MTRVRQLQKLMRYKAWANRLLFQTVAGLPEVALMAPQPIIFSSLLRTLHHVYAMDAVWRAHLRGEAHGFTSRNPDACPTFAVLREAQISMDDWYSAYTADLSDATCDEVIAFTFIGGGNGRMRREDMLLHVVNHATYHRGHVASMLYQISVPPPTTDFPVFLREDDATSA